jgi:hypothetical protein
MIAYIDPSSASLVWQGIVAGVLGAGVAIKVFWKRIVGFVTRRNGRAAAAPASPDGASPDGEAAGPPQPDEPFSAPASAPAEAEPTE